MGGVGDVGQAHLEGPAVRAVTQVGLGARGIRGPYDGRVHGRGRGPDRVHHSRADATRRVVGAVVTCRVCDRVGRAHHEVTDERVLLGGAQGREGRVGRDPLAHEGGDSGNLGRGLGRARLATVVVAGASRHHLAAGSRDLGLEAQVVGRTRAGEIGDGDRPRAQVRRVLLVHGGDGQGRGVERREAEEARIRVGAKAGSAIVAGGRVHHDPGLGQALVHLRVQGHGVATHPLERREGDGEGIGLDDRRVVEGRQERSVVGRVRVVAGDLRDDELGSRRGPREGGAVRGRKGRDVCALLRRSAARVTCRRVRIPVPVVVREGNLVTNPRAVLACAEAGGK